MARHPYLERLSPIPFAHRGGAAEWPENTMEAFGGAYRMGYRYVETDVHLSADGTIVAFHDTGLERVGGMQREIADMTWDQLQRIRINGTGRIPTLSWLLTEFPDIKLNIDMKSDAVVEPLISLISEFDAFDRVCFASFFERRVVRVTEIAGDHACISSGRGGVIRHVLRSFKLPVALTSTQILQVPMVRYGVRVLTRRFIELAHQHGKVVHVWTIDDADEMRRLLDWGVDGIMTDRPRVLKSVFQERGIW